MTGRIVLTSEQRDEVAKRYRGGETIDQLATAFGCSTAPIRRALKERRVRMRVGSHSGRGLGLHGRIS